MTLDDIEQLAAKVHARNASVKFGDPRYSCRVGSDELLALLLAVKRMLPVVRAAEAWREQHERRWAETMRRAMDPMYVFLPDDVRALVDAIDTLRAALGKESP